MHQGNVVLVGNAVSDVTHRITADGTHWAKFRIVVQYSRFDRRRNEWVDGEPSFLNVVAWRTLAENVAASIHRGDPVIVSGKFRVRNWEYNGKTGTDIDVDAQAIGHDLARGRAEFSRPKRVAEGSIEPVEPAA